MSTVFINRLFRLLLSGLAILGIGATDTAGTWEKKRITIEPGSKVYIKGTSNVNAFTCHCDDVYPGQTIDLEKNGGYAKFKNVDLQLRSARFDCHNRRIDSDMQKALKADAYPFIKIALLDCWTEPKCLGGACQGWFDIQAKVNLSITNTTKMQSIAAKARSLGPNRLQVTGETALQMSAFGIDPPSAMFGMIKVNDWITIHFDMIITVESIQ